MTTSANFVRELVPPARSFYQEELGGIARPTHAGWCACRCPFHKSKSGKSFAVHVDGAFVCRGCGVRGGDLVAFVRLRYNLSFRAAAISLGCWRDVRPEERRALDERAMHQARERERAAEVKEEGKRRRLALRSEIHVTAAIRRRANARLAEIGRGAAPAFEGEAEECWAILAITQADLRETEDQYNQACGLDEVKL